MKCLINDCDVAFVHLYMNNLKIVLMIICKSNTFNVAHFVLLPFETSLDDWAS